MLTQLCSSPCDVTVPHQVNGANRCLGSIQELKNKYSQGYTVCLLMEPEVQTAAMNFIEERFEGAILKENYPGKYKLFLIKTWHFTSQIPKHIFRLLSV